MTRRINRAKIYAPRYDVREIRHDAQRFLNAQKVLTMIYKSSLPYAAKVELRAQALDGDLDGAMDSMKRMLMER